MGTDLYDFGEKVKRKREDKFRLVGMKMDYILRKARSTDTLKIEELFVEMLKAIYHRDDVKGYESGYLDKFFLGKEDWICVAECESDVVAFLSIEVYQDEGYIYLDDLSVTKEYRNRGVGTKLIHTAEKYAEEMGVTKIVLHVEKANENAHRLYSRLGYREVTDEGSRILMSKSVK